MIIVYLSFHLIVCLFVCLFVCFSCTGYYFIPMIIVSWLSILTAVFVTVSYYQEKSKPVPQWLQKFFKFEKITKTTGDVVCECDFSDDWRKVACIINKYMLIISSILTLFAVLVTIILLMMLMISEN